MCPYCNTENAADAAACGGCASPLSNSQFVTQRTRPRLEELPPENTPDSGPEPPGTVPVDEIPLIPPKLDAVPPEDVVGPITGPPVSARLLAAAAAAQPAEEAPGRRSSVPPSTEASRPRLRVIRGLKINAEYPIYDGQNLVGRPDDRPVDIDIEEQEPADRIWSSRQHAIITCENGKLAIEDLNSLNGTFVNRQRVHPGRKRTLLANDVVTIGTIHLKVIV
jgi:hypothetical protein